jgi:hypothetical protein
MEWSLIFWPYSPFRRIPEVVQLNNRMETSKFHHKNERKQKPLRIRGSQPNCRELLRPQIPKKRLLRDTEKI